MKKYSIIPLPIRAVYSDEAVLDITEGRAKFVEDGHWGDVCFNHALEDGTLWNCQEAFDRVVEEFTPINYSEAREGDFVTYHNIIRKGIPPSRFNAGHFCIIHKKTKNVADCIVRGKWGGLGVFDSRIEDILEEYGNTVVFWRRK